jgi:hypothetical protein
MLGLRLGGTVPLVPLMTSWPAQGHLYLYCCTLFSLLAVSYGLKAQIRHTSLTGVVGKCRTILIYAGMLLGTTQMMFICVCVELQMEPYRYNTRKIRKYTVVCESQFLLGVSAKLRKATVSFVVSCPSVRPPAWNNSALTGRIFMKFDI